MAIDELSTPTNYPYMREIFGLKTEKFMSISLPDPYSSIFPTRQMPPIPPRFTLPGAEVKLQNADLWAEFHQIGTEMIITKCGR